MGLPVWYMRIIANDQISNAKIDFKNGILLHGGGWKKMEDKKYPIKNLDNYSNKK